MDKLSELFEQFKAANKKPTQLQLFQGGFTAAAQSMRARAVSAIQASALDDDAKNALLNAIGSLPDIPA